MNPWANPLREEGDLAAYHFVPSRDLWSNGWISCYLFRMAMGGNRLRAALLEISIRKQDSTAEWPACCMPNELLQGGKGRTSRSLPTRKWSRNTENTCKSFWGAWWACQNLRRRI